MASGLALDFTFGATYFRTGTLEGAALNDLGIATATQAAATTVDYAGGRQQIAANTPRVSPLGLLVEGARTNSLTWAEDFTNAAWTKDALTTTANAGPDPNGGTMADKFVPTTSNVLHRIARGGGARTANTLSGFSVYLKADGYPNVRLLAVGSSGFSADFDLSTGAVSNAVGQFGGNAPTVATMLHLGGGIYRCTIAGTFNADQANVSLQIIPLVSGSGTFAGDGTSGFQAWGAMWPDGHLSYVPTTSASVTHFADGLTLAMPAGSTADEIQVTYGSGTVARVLRSALASANVLNLASSGGAPWLNSQITKIELLPASVARARELGRIKAAIRTLGQHPAGSHRLAANDTPSLSVGTSTTAISGSVAIARDSAKLSYIGGVPVVPGSGFPDNQYYGARGAYYGRNGANTADVYAAAYFAFEFQHTGTQFEVAAWGQGGSFRVLVNGVPGPAVTLPVDGGQYLVLATFPASGTRRITIESNGVRFAGVRSASAADVQGVGRDYPLVTVIGDSFIEGTGQTSPGGMEAAVMGRALGFSIAPAGVGGTGLINPGNNNVAGGPKVNFTDTVRLKDLTLSGVTAAQPGFVAVPLLGVVFASVNDGSAIWSSVAGATNIEDAMERQCWKIIDAWQAANPLRPLVFFGPTWPNGDPGLDLFRLRDGVRNACAAAYSLGVRFIDRLDPNPRRRLGAMSWLSTTGNTTNGSAIVSGLASTSGVVAGSGISGPGIPDGAVVLTVNSSTQVTLSHNATATATGAALVFRNTQAAHYTFLTGGDITHPGQRGHLHDGLANAEDLRRVLLTEF